MTDQEFFDFHTARLRELPAEIREKAVAVVNEVLSETEKAMVRELAKAQPHHWISPHHFGWGMWLRNQLRDSGLNDCLLPSKNWDDYYVPVVELALGIRKESGELAVPQAVSGEEPTLKKVHAGGNGCGAP